MTIYIGIYSASKEITDCLLWSEITRLVSRLAKRSSDLKVEHAAHLDITFCLPSEFEKPQFEGLRMGGYTSDNSTLYFECSVPKEMLDDRNAGRYVSAVIADALDNASDYFQEISLGFDVAPWHRILEDCN